MTAIELNLAAFKLVMLRAKAEKAKADKDPQVISSKIEFWEVDE